MGALSLPPSTFSFQLGHWQETQQQGSVVRALTCWAPDLISDLKMWHVDDRQNTPRKARPWYIAQSLVHLHGLQRLLQSDTVCPLTLMCNSCL